jgi:hypothetical protein
MDWLIFYFNLIIFVIFVSCLHLSDILAHFWALLRHCENQLLASSCLSVPPHGVPQASSQWIFMKFVFEHFLKICPENSTFILIWKEWQVLFMKTSIPFWSYLDQFFLEREMFQIKVEEEIKTHFMFSNFFL